MVEGPSGWAHDRCLEVAYAYTVAVRMVPTVTRNAGPVVLPISM